MKDLIIRKDRIGDHPQISALITAAFEQDPHSDHREHILVDKLRLKSSFIPDLSLVAELNGNVTGYILLTPVSIKNDNTSFPALALAPLAVKPEFQKMGIGSLLVNHAHGNAKSLGYERIVVVGHENYYPRFGYIPASSRGIYFPFEVPDKNAMLLEIKPLNVKNVQGIVNYPEEFLE